MAVTAAAGPPVHAGAPHDERPIWRRPNLLRAILFFFGGAGFAYVLVGVIRTAMHESHPWHTWNAFLQVGLIAGPMFFLVGLGAFDYWFYWAAGRPTRPEDHSGHGAYSWRDYFRINTDHKVIGIQYTVHSFVFLLIGGMFAMLMRAELAQPGMQFMNPNVFNGLFSVHASILIFLFIIPVFAGLANFVLPLMIGAPDMAFPRLNAVSFWLLPIGGLMMLASFLAPRGALSPRRAGPAPPSAPAPPRQSLFPPRGPVPRAPSVAPPPQLPVSHPPLPAPR